MTVTDRVKQKPDPGSHILRFRGDTQSFVLSLPNAEAGGAWLRTNIGHAREQRDEITREVLHEETRLHKDWFDIPMESIDGQHFNATLALYEVGHFEAKCFFLPEGQSDPVWPAGDNITINVEPAETCCANIVYNAFVRQFGPNKEGKTPQPWAVKESIQILDGDGYTVIPPSGTFRDFITELDFIIGELGCRIIQLLPIHPTPTTYARMGRFGSPYAALSFTTVDPALAEVDPRATPTEQFKELVDAIHERNAKLIIDIAINHTGWAARLHNTHPEWLARDTDGTIEAPGAWGVTWADLTKLDYTHKELWQYMAEVFLLWCRRGVDGFRCDAGYMIPSSAWRYMVAEVRKQFPDTIFLLEGLGGSISATRDILNTANLNWAYSELFQNYDRTQIEHYLPEPLEISREDGIMIHFAETHDNLRLAERSEVYARMRTALCALCSQHGGFGFANGVEWFATERINVHKANSLNWGNESNQIELIQRLSILLKHHPAFHDCVEISMIHQRKGNAVALLRCHIPSNKRLLVVANLDVEKPAVAGWDSRQTGMDSNIFLDLITGNKIAFQGAHGKQTCRLDPGEVLCLTQDREDLERLPVPVEQRFVVPDRIVHQCLRAKAMDVHRFYKGTTHIGDMDPERSAMALAKDPAAYCRNLNIINEEPRVITWQWPEDTRREVMIPPDHFLLVRAEASFCAQIVDRSTDGGEIVLDRENSLPCLDGSHFALFSPGPCPERLMRLLLRLSVYSPSHSEHKDAHLLVLPKGEQSWVLRRFTRSELLHGPHLLLGTNGRGGMLRAHVAWSRLHSKYDALLAANLNPDFPEDRWVMFCRCRAWLVYQGYSREIDNDCLDSFSYDDHFRGRWKYRLPCGQGQHVLLTILLEMAHGANAVQLSFYRHKSDGSESLLSDAKAVRIILRPDVEDRNFHHTTKGYQGPEHDWPKSISAESGAFTFSPAPGRELHVRVSEGEFVSEPEWHYMVYRSLEAERGMDPDSDLFSPGYFTASLQGGQPVYLIAQVRSNGDDSTDWKEPPEDLEDSLSEVERSLSLEEALFKAMHAFVVSRKKLHTVIAGYPWFLDWGRDTLIFVRGLIAAGETSTAGAILEQFGRYEDQGTLPNTIRGDHVANRDTSDAPLWFFVACSELASAQGNEIFLDTDCGGRTIRQVLKSIAHSMIAGTSNGIRVDPDSGLIFSPSHFTWMDTNHPAGTPREGYPIEIQALWHFAASFMARIDDSESSSFWRDRAAIVKQSIIDLFFLEGEGFLSDCLHAKPGEPAASARPDDALRPNQIFAVTLGAVTDPNLCRNIVHACETLIVPGAIRSLADRELRYPLPIVHQGKTINQPSQPYQGKYEGDEDSQRKPAYHNGTAWTWVFPSFCEAWVRVYGDKTKQTALAWLGSAVPGMNSGCVGHVPEILDGDYPHTQRGCDAQAWGASELLRVLVAMKKPKAFG